MPGACVTDGTGASGATGGIAAWGADGGVGACGDDGGWLSKSCAMTEGLATRAMNDASSIAVRVLVFIIFSAFCSDN